MDPPWYSRVLYNYIDYPVLYDITFALGVVAANALCVRYYGVVFALNNEGITDMSNELVSSSLSAGGFVLAALAIIASIKQSVPEKKPGDVVHTGKEYFYNTKYYRNILRLYAVACIVFLVLFLYFSALRVIEPVNSPVYTPFNLLIFGTSILFTTFMRCVGILWAMVRIK